MTLSEIGLDVKALVHELSRLLIFRLYGVNDLQSGIHPDLSD